MKTFKQFLTEEVETKEQLNEAWLPKETSLNLSLGETGYDYLDNNYEQSYFEVSSDMIKAMIKAVKSQSDRDWLYNSGCENEKEAKEEKEWYIKTLNEWLKFKYEEEALLQEIDMLIDLEDGYFNHKEFIKAIKQYLKNFSK